MAAYKKLAAAGTQSRIMQNVIRQSTFAPGTTKSLRRFSSWEAIELILKVNRNTFTKKIRNDDGMPTGTVTGDTSSARWFSLDELNQIRHAWVERGGRMPIVPKRPEGKRAIRAAVANFKGGVGKSTTALHYAHAAALDGYRVLVVDFDPQATISHAMGLSDVPEDLTVWGIIARDLMRETKRINLRRKIAGEGEPFPYPRGLEETMVHQLADDAFISGTCWPTIDMIGSCANAAFVEFASAQYRMANGAWSFYAAVDRYLDRLPPDRYDIIIFDCPPAIGYQSLNAVFAADVLCIPTGPGYWEYDSTTSFMNQLSEALSEIDVTDDALQPDKPVQQPKDFAAIRVVLTRYEPSNELHIAMRKGLKRAFGDWVTEHPIELTRAVEQSGRFLRSIYEIDYRTMTRDTWKRARRSFDAAYDEFKATLLSSWDSIPDAKDEAAEPRPEKVA